jgi:hypothetical protein
VLWKPWECGKSDVTSHYNCRAPLFTIAPARSSGGGCPATGRTEEGMFSATASPPCRYPVHARHAFRALTTEHSCGIFENRGIWREKCWCLMFYLFVVYLTADHSSRAIYGMNRLHPLKHWDRGFESHSRHACLCAIILCSCYSVCRQRPSNGLIPRLRSPTDCVWTKKLEKLPRSTRALKPLIDRKIVYLLCIASSFLKEEIKLNYISR